MQGKRILFVCDRVLSDPGGLAVASERISAHAQHAGSECVVIAPDHGAGTQNDAAAVPIVRVAGAGRSDARLRWAETTDRVIEDFRPHLVHGIYASTAGFIAASCARKAGVPSIISVRGNDLDHDYYRPERLPLLREAMSLATAITGVSRAACRNVSALFDRPAEHISNSIDTEAFRPASDEESIEIRSRLGLASSFVLGFSGELREKKGMRFLLPAFARLRQTLDVKLLLIGGVRADDQRHYEEFLARLPALRAHIVAVPYKREPAHLCAHLSACDALVFPSLREGTPNAVLEAMACERPVLATKVGGHRDLLQHGDNGFLLPVSHLDRLAEALEELCAVSRSERQALGQAARRFVLAHHTPTQEAQAYQQLYQSLLSA